MGLGRSRRTGGLCAGCGSYLSGQASEASREAAGLIEASAGKIHTFFATVQVGDRKGQYWRRGDDFRARESGLPGYTVDAERIRGRVRMVTTGSAPAALEEGRIIVADRDRRCVETDAYEWVLLEAPVSLYTKPPTRRLTMAELLKSAKKVGENHYRATIGKSFTYDVWMDPARGMAARCDVVSSRENGHVFRFKFRVLDWQKVGGLDLPAKVEKVTEYNGKHSQTLVATIGQVRINEPGFAMPKLPAPARGALVMDEHRSVAYRIDENWKRISEEVPVMDGSIGG